MPDFRSCSMSAPTPQKREKSARLPKRRSNSAWRPASFSESFSPTNRGWPTSSPITSSGIEDARGHGDVIQEHRTGRSIEQGAKPCCQFRRARREVERRQRGNGIRTHGEDVLGSSDVVEEGLFRHVDVNCSRPRAIATARSTNRSQDPRGTQGPSPVVPKRSKPSTPPAI